VRRHVDRAGAEEERDLGERVRCDVEEAAGDADRVEQRDAEDDVRELADGGVGQPRLQVVLRERDDRADQNRDRNEVRRGQPEMELPIKSTPKT